MTEPDPRWRRRPRHRSSLERALDDDPGCVAAATDADKFEAETEKRHELELQSQRAIPKRHAEKLRRLLTEKGFGVEGG
jgi:hypothetical protein